MCHHMLAGWMQIDIISVGDESCCPSGAAGSSVHWFPAFDVSMQPCCTSFPSAPFDCLAQQCCMHRHGRLDRKSPTLAHSHPSTCQVCGAHLYSHRPSYIFSMKEAIVLGAFQSPLLTCSGKGCKLMQARQHTEQRNAACSLAHAPAAAPRIIHLSTLPPQRPQRHRQQLQLTLLFRPLPE